MLQIRPAPAQLGEDPFPQRSLSPPPALIEKFTERFGSGALGFHELRTDPPLDPASLRSPHAHLLSRPSGVRERGYGEGSQTQGLPGAP